MANNPYVNKVEFGNTTVMDISDTTAVESDVASGKYFYKANGEKVSGSASAPTSITPSDNNPVALTADTPVNPTTNGYAIETITGLAPSNSTPASITNGTIYKATGGGYAISNYANVSPSSSGQSLSSGTIYKMNSAGYVYSTEQNGKEFNFSSTAHCRQIVNKVNIAKNGTYNVDTAGIGKPTLIIVYAVYGAAAYYILVYNTTNDTYYSMRGDGNVGVLTISNITNAGFTINNTSASYNVYTSVVVYK